MTHSLTYDTFVEGNYTIVTKNETGKPADIRIWPTKLLKSEMSAMDMWNYISGAGYYYGDFHPIYHGKIVNVWKFLAKRYNRYYVKGEILTPDDLRVLNERFGKTSNPSDDISEFLEMYNPETDKFIDKTNRVNVVMNRDDFVIGSKNVGMMEIINAFEKYTDIKIPECSISDYYNNIIIKESGYFTTTNYVLSGAFVLSILPLANPEEQKDTLPIPKKIGDLEKLNPKAPENPVPTDIKSIKYPELAAVVTEKIFGTNKLIFINGNLQVDDKLTVLHKITQDGVIVHNAGNKLILKRSNLLTSYIENGNFRMILLNGEVYDVAVLHPEYERILQKLDRKMNKFIN